MPGVVLLAPVSLAALFLLGDRASMVAVGTSIGILVAFWLFALVEGVEFALASSRFLVILPALLMPVAFVTWHGRLLSAVDRLQRDSGSGLLNRIGFEAHAAVFDLSNWHTPLFIVVSVRLPARDDTSRQEVMRIGELLRTTLPNGGFLARTSATEFSAGAWVNGWDPAGADVDRIRSSLVQAELTAPRGHALVWGCAVVEHLDEPADQTARSWTVQRSVAAAEVRQRQMTFDRVVRHSDDISASDIRSVITAGGPDMVFQPIRRISDETIVGYEALSRFSSREGPEQWYAAAAATGLAGPLETAAVKKALESSAHLPADVFVSINLSPATLISETALRQTLATAALGRLVVVEITEGQALSLTDEVQVIIDDLRASGIRIALDDVGAGHSGFRQLLTVRPDVIKLDAYICRNIDADTLHQDLVTSLVAFANAAGITCIVEGVETRKELEAVRVCGGELVQGYATGHPARLDTS